MLPFSWSFFRPADPAPRLFDGRPLWIGPVTPAAKPLIVRGLERISPETSRLRFFTVRHRFSDEELEAMTNLDGHVRFALGATVRDPAGNVEPVGIARFARLADAPTVAEVAILVIDAFQGQGVGRTLLKRLAAAALAQGILRFRGIVLPENRPIIRLLTGYAPDPAIFRSDGHLTIDVDLAPNRHGAAA
jgi:GNAT superfamily N-acetyltransferase